MIKNLEPAADRFRHKFSTTTMMSDRNIPDWNVYYTSLDGVHQESVLMKYSGINGYDERCRRMVNNPQIFLDWVNKTKIYNFVLLPSFEEGNNSFLPKIKIVHGCVTQENNIQGPQKLSVMAYFGKHFTAPIKSFDPSLVTIPLNIASELSPNLRVPSLNDMLHVSSPIEFKRLCGDITAKSIMEYNNDYPNGMILHHLIFNKLQPETTITPWDLAFRIITMVSTLYFERKNDNNPDAVWKKARYILVYLWLVSQGCGYDVNLGDAKLNDDNEILLTNHLIEAIKISKNGLNTTVAISNNNLDRKRKPSDNDEDEYSIQCTRTDGK